MDQALRSPHEVLPPKSREHLRLGPLPGATPLMQPVAIPREDPGSGWLFEPLFDGVRCLAVCDGDSVQMLEQGTRPLAHRLPDLERALVAAGPRRFAVDGEIVALDPWFEERIAQPETRRLEENPQERQHRFLAFDLLYAADHDLTAVPLVDRRCVLRALFRFSRTVMYVSASSDPGETVFGRAERQGWLGVVAKRGDAAYFRGTSPDWRVWRRHEIRGAG